MDQDLLLEDETWVSRWRLDLKLGGILYEDAAKVEIDRESPFLEPLDQQVLESES